MRRVPMFDLEAERALLGALLIDPARIVEAEGLAREDFYDPRHRAIWAAMVAMREPFDAITLKGQLAAQGASSPPVLEALRVIEESALSAAHLSRHVATVQDRATRRRLAAAAERIAALAAQPAPKVRQLVDEAERVLLDIGGRGGVREPETSPEVMKAALTRIQQQRDAGGVTGVTWGLPSLDAYTTGLNPGELWVLAARPGQGKSALALNVALAAADSGVPVLLSSYEMRNAEQGIRAIAGGAKVAISRARGGRLSETEMAAIQRSAAHIWRLPILWDDSPSATIADIRAQARRAKQRDPRLGLLIIDYLQLVEAADKREARHLAVAQVSRGLKQLARELEIPILALAQLNREVEKSARLPQLSDLRESGSIEQDADAVAFLHYEADAVPKGETGAMDGWVVVAKQRNGPRGRVPVVFHSRLTTFTDGAPMPEAPHPVQQQIGGMQ